MMVPLCPSLHSCHRQPTTCIPHLSLFLLPPSLLRVTFPEFFLFPMSSYSMHMVWHRIKHYSVDKSLQRKVMTQVDLHVCVHVCERGGTLRLTGSFIEENTVAVCSEQTVKCVTQTLEEEFPSHLDHIWELAQRPLFLLFFLSGLLCLYSQVSPHCRPLSLLHFCTFSTVPPWILVA